MENGVLRPEVMDANTLDPALLKELGVIVPGEAYEPKLPKADPGDVVLELKNLTLRHQNNVIFRNVNGSFRSGCIYAVLGESGCGKSSLFGALSGLYSYQGQALLQGRDLRKLRKKDLEKLDLSHRIPDQFVSDTVREEILVGLKKREDAERKNRGNPAGHPALALPGYFSLYAEPGTAATLGVAALMAYPCKVLVCDEPTYAQDRNNTAAIMDSLCRQAREHGVTLIFSTHDRQLAQDYADEILELKGGSLCVH